jgi:hypothetical protein
MAARGNRSIAIRLTMTEAETIRKTLRDFKDDGAAAMKALEDGANRAAPAVQKIEPAAGSASNGMQRFSSVMGQAGYQVQDFATQVAMGGNALQAFGVQGAQLLGVFGPAGAIAGAVLMVGTLATGLLTVGNNAKEAERSAKASFEGMATAATQLKSVLLEVNALFLTNAERSAASANAARSELQTRTQTLLAGAVQRNEGNVSELAEARTYLARLEEYAAREEAARARARASGQLVTEGEALTDRGNLFQARARVQGLEQDIERTSGKIGEMNEALKRLGNAGRLGAEEYGPLSADPGGVNALRASLDNRFRAQQEYQSKVGEINAKLREGYITAADAETLTAQATTQRDEALKKIADSANRAAKETREYLATAYEINEDGTQGAAFKRAASVETYLDRLRGKQEQQNERDAEKATQAREKAEKDQQRAMERAQRDLDRTAERWGDSMARETYSALETAFDKSKSPAQAAAAVFGSALRTAAQAALSQLVFQPAIKGVLGSLTGTGVGDALGAGTTATSSGGVSYFDTASGLFKLSGGIGGSSIYDSGSLVYDLTGGTGGSLGGALSNAANTWGYNTGLFSATGAAGSGLGSTAAGGTAFALDMSGGAAQTAMSQANPAFFGTTMGTIGGVAGVAGGAYGIYSGINRGGVGGAVQTAGGVAGVVGGLGTLAAAGGAVGGGLMAAAPWLAAAGPCGLAAAAVLAIIGSLLPGQKPSDMTGVYRGNLHAGTSEVTGLTGDRFSQENRDLASQVGQQVKTLAEGLQTVTGATAIPFNYEIKAGNRDGIAALYGPGGGTWHEYERNEESIGQLVQDMTQALIDSMKGLASAEVQSVISHSSGTEATLQNLDWYNGVFKQLTAGARGDPLPAFTQQINALVAPIDEAIAKAKSLGLSEAELNTVRQKSIDGLIEQRAQTLISIQQSDDLRRETAAGVSPLVQQINGWARTSSAEVKALNEQLIQLGLSEAERQPLVSGRWQTLDAEYGSLTRQRDLAVTNNTNSLWDRIQSASGNGNTLEGAKWDYERRAQAEWMAAAADGITDLTLLAKVQAEERLQIERDYAERSAQIEEASMSQRLDALETLRSQSEILTTFLDRQEVSGPGVSSQQAFLAAQEQYSAALSSARNGGDLSAYTSAAQTLLDTNYAYNATGAQGTAVRDMVLSATRSLGATLDLPGFSANWEAGLARYMAPNTDALSRLTDQVNALYEELRDQRLLAS